MLDFLWYFYSQHTCECHTAVLVKAAAADAPRRHFALKPAITKLRAGLNIQRPVPAAAARLFKPLSRYSLCSLQYTWPWIGSTMLSHV
jgi:hypothetical protein